MANNWGPVNLVQDGVTAFNASDMNKIITSLVDRTDFLNDAINHNTSSVGLTYTDTGFDSSITDLPHAAGTIVAFVDGKYVPAKAVWSAQARVDGSVAPAPDAYIVGVLITDITQGYATILAYGCISDSALITYILGDTPTSGQYFLTEEGGVVLGTDAALEVPIYCLTYCTTANGTGKIIFNPKMPEYSGHSHSFVDLSGQSWVLEGATTSYLDGSTITALAALLGSTLTNYTMVSNGQVIDPADVTISGSTIAVNYFVQPADKIYLYAINPMQGKDPLVHTVTVDDRSQLISSENLNGNVVLSVSSTPAASNVFTGSAIVSFDGNTFCTGPVIQAIQAGPGITLRGATNGVVYVGCSEFDQGQLDVNITNLDGVLFGTDPSRVTYKFPAGISSRLYGTVRIPHFEGYPTFSPKLNLIFDGGSSDSTISGLTASVTMIPMPTEDSMSALIGPVDVAFSSVTIPANRYGLVGGTIPGLQLTSGAVLSIQIYASSPNESLELVAASVQLA